VFEDSKSKKRKKLYIYINTHTPRCSSILRPTYPCAATSYFTFSVFFVLSFFFLKSYDGDDDD